MIAVREVSKNYGAQAAVRDVSFTVREQETLALLGTSGCGKTTTLKMINRLVEPSGGQIELNGTDIRQLEAHVLRRQIGYVIQDTGLFPHYTVADNIATVPRLLRWDEAKIRHRIGELLDLLQLPQTSLTRYPHELSGGQLQRIGLARALAARPAILLMDEPLGALDPITRLGIRREFLRLDELRQKTTVLVTHDVQEAFELGDRVGLMDQGQLVQLGTPKELLLRPANDFVRNFFLDQRLSLQLRIFTLSDIAPFLSFAPTANAENAIELKPQTSLVEALEKGNGSSPLIFRAAGGWIPIDASAIWSGLNGLARASTA